MERKRENEANIRERRARGEKGKGRERERREMKRNLASTATEGWFTAVSGFLASYFYKITLLERPSLRKRRETDFISDLPEAEHRGN